MKLRLTLSPRWLSFACVSGVTLGALVPFSWPLHVGRAEAATGTCSCTFTLEQVRP